MANIDVVEILIDMVADIDGVEESISKMEVLDRVTESYDGETFEADADLDTAEAQAKAHALESTLSSIDDHDITGGGGFSFPDDDFDLDTIISPPDFGGETWNTIQTGSFSFPDDSFSAMSPDSNITEFIDVSGRDLTEALGGDGGGFGDLSGRNLAEMVTDENIDRTGREFTFPDDDFDLDTIISPPDFMRDKPVSTTRNMEEVEDVLDDRLPIIKQKTGGEFILGGDDELDDIDMESMWRRATGAVEEFEIDEGFDLGTMGDDFGGLTDRRGLIGNLRRRNIKGVFGNLKSRFRRLERTLEGLNLRMSQFYNALADVIPLMIVFVAALPVAISALVALASAAVAAGASLGAIGALGLFGMGVQEAGGQEGSMQAIMERLSELGSDILATFMPLAERFAPLMRDALNGLLRTFERIAVEMRGLLDLRSAARDFGQFVSDALVNLADTAIRLFDAFLPTFRLIADAVSETNVLNAVVQDTADVLPILIILLQQVAGAIAHIVEISKGFLFVAVIMTGVIGTVYDFLRAIVAMVVGTEEADQVLGFMIGTVLALTTVFVLASKALLGLSAVTSTYIGTALASVAVTLKDVAAKYALAAANLVAAAAGGSFLVVLTGILVTAGILVGIIFLLVGGFKILSNWVSSLTSDFGAMNSNIKESQKALENFGKTKENLGGMGSGFGNTMDAGGSGNNIYYDNTVNIEGGDENNARRENRKMAFEGQSTSQ